VLAKCLREWLLLAGGEANVAVRLSRTWEVGATDERELTVSIPGRDRGDDKSFPWETLVIGSMGNLQTPDLWEVYIDQVDDGGVIGPIHLPCTIHVPGARTILVRPTSAVTAQTTIASATYVADHRGFRSFAQWSKALIPGEIIAIPQWVRGVGVVDPGTYLFLDRAGGVLSAALDSACDRPALAAAVECVVGGVVLFYY
jgi:hypothetical protein